MNTSVMSLGWTGNARSRTIAVALVLVALGFMAAPLWVWDGGVVEIETTFFIQQYLGGRTVLQKVFDPYANDLRTYQARELSYFIDYLDAQAFSVLLGSGVVLLIPASALVASLLTAAAFYRGTSRVMPHVGPVTATLMLLVYVTNFVYLVTLGVFYRSTKPLLAATLLAALFYVADTLRPAPDNTGRPRIFTSSFLCVFGFGVGMSLLDRQGFFYTVVLVGALAVCVLFRVRRVDLLAGAFAAASAMLLYNVAIGPAIVHAVNGYWPGLDYQKLPATALVTDARYTLASLELVAETARIMLGSFPAWVYVLGAGGGLVIAFGRRPRHRDSALGSRGGALRTRPWMLPCLLLLLVASSQVLMFALMILRHPPVYEWPDHRLWYYPLPYQAVLLFGMAMLLGKGLIRGGHKQVWAVNLLLVVVVIGNISHWRDYRRAMLRSPWFPTVYYQSGALKHSLRDRRPAPYLNREYGGFYEFCVRRLPAKR